MGDDDYGLAARRNPRSAESGAGSRVILGGQRTAQNRNRGSQGIE